MGNIDKIKIELDQEFTRMEDENYCGVIFVHPDDVDFVKAYMSIYAGVYKSHVKLPKGGALAIRTVERNNPHHDHAGCQYTSILIDCDCFGSHDNEFNYNQIGTVSPQEFIAYMITRSRSESKHHSHVVIF